MRSKIFSRQILFSNLAILIYLALIKLVIHLLTSTRYEYFIDELYTIAESKHLDFGFVDMPPLVPAILAVNGWLFGFSLFAIHILPAINGALMVLFTGLMVRKLGGGRFAQILAAVSTMVALVWLYFNSVFTYDSFDQLITVIFFYVLIAILKNQNPKLWLVLGIVAGVGLMTKLGMLFYGFALIIALLLTPNRKYFTDKWLWLSGVIAFIIFSPYLIWQSIHGWPLLEYWQNYSRYGTYHATPWEYLLMLVIIMHPLTLPIWSLGLYHYLFSKQGKPYRLLGSMYLILFVIFVMLKAKVYMLASTYVMLFAAGALEIEKFIIQHQWSWLKPVYISLLVITGVFLAPNALPVLSPEQLVNYYRISSSFSGVKAVKTENSQTWQFPQYITDKFGWKNLVTTIAKVYRKLPAAEKAKCAILTGHYGQAGAIDLLGERYHLPKAICGHLSYYIWGPGNFSGDVAVAVGIPLEKLQQAFSQVEKAAVVNSKYCMPSETNLPVYICRKLMLPVKEAWPLVKRF